MTTHTFDIVVLGGGSGGYAAALRASELGKSVALIEKDKVGGTCLHRGCIPTKALLHAAEVADTARDGAQFGVKTTFESIDMAGVHSYKDRVVSRLHKGLQGLVKSGGIDYVEGGWPGANPTDTAFFAQPPSLHRARLAAFGMTRRSGRSAENDPGLVTLLGAAACLYTMTEDKRFVLGPLADGPAVIAVSACSGHGFKFGAAVGDAVASAAVISSPQWASWAPV